MEEIINEIIEEYKNKGINIVIDKETENTITLLITTRFNRHKFVEDLEILKICTNKELINSNIDYLVHNSLNRFLRGE